MACITIGLGLLWLVLVLVRLPVLVSCLHVPVHSCEDPVRLPQLPHQRPEPLASVCRVGCISEQLHRRLQYMHGILRCHGAACVEGPVWWCATCRDTATAYNCTGRNNARAQSRSCHRSTITQMAHSMDVIFKNWIRTASTQPGPVYGSTCIAVE
jgi:hypothetical protein